MIAPTLETISPATVHEPFGLSPEAIERIARDAGVQDANTVRRVLRAYEHSNERHNRDSWLMGEAVRTSLSVT